MNPVRKTVHAVMEMTGLDHHIDQYRINAWIEGHRARQFRIVPREDANRWIGETIAAGRAAALGKIGDRECCALAAHLGLRQFYKYTWAAPSYGESDLCQQAGVFPPTAKAYADFADFFLERLRSVDACAVWQNPGETEILSRFCPSALRFELQALEPYFFRPPWSAQLLGKRILIVHPFDSSIRAQFSRRKLVWQSLPDVLPDCEIEVIRAPYGFANTTFRDWFEMFRCLEDKVTLAFAKRRFHVALIGCGAAGLPLAVKVKSLNAIGIHVGGALQILFGIRGQRWEKLPGFDHLFNRNWVRPLPEETPEMAGRVDNGGYW